MNCKESLDYIYSTVWKGSRPGLGRTLELLGMMGNIQDKLRYVHVAGTNGKGSVCAMTAKILKESGYRTGLYISPGLRSFNERMSVNGEFITDAELAELATYVRSFADKMEDSPTEFELTTVIAFEFFYRKKCDVVVLEVGMGGRLDSTNVIKSPEVSVITGIALDHTAFLGDTVEKIAAEKAGIIKSRRPVVYGGDSKAAETVIRAKAREEDAPYHTSSADEVKVVSRTLDGTVFTYGGREYKTSLVGDYQRSNIATVMKTVEVLRSNGYGIPDSAVEKGLAAVYWPARFEILSRDPLMIYDGAHNPQGLESCVRTVKELFKNKKVIVLSGVMADKDFSVMLPMIKKIAARVYTVRPDSHRSLGARKYASLFNSAGVEAHSSNSVKTGVEKAYADGKKTGLPVIMLGTLYMYKEVRDAFDAIAEDKR